MRMNDPSTIERTQRKNMNHIHPHEEHGDDHSLSFDRRSFLKLSGFTFAGTVLAGCSQANVEKAIPFLIQPEEVTPGVAYWFATTCGGCNAGCGVLAKNRDGRPIKLEGNSKHPISKGGLCAIGQSHLLALYDSHRLAAPWAYGKQTSWEVLDADVNARLKEIRNRNGSVRILTHSITGPTTRSVIRQFVGTFKDARHVEYDPVSVSAILDAHEQTHGGRILPAYRFERAKVIVSFDADFLGTWISPVEFTKGYRAGRMLDGANSSFSYHAQIESQLSLTGSNADRRMKVSPNELRELLVGLTAIVRAKLGERRSSNAPTLSSRLVPFADELAQRLIDHRGESLVVCGVNDLACQIATNALNEFLGNYGSTLDIRHPSYQYRGNDAELRALVGEIESGRISALFIEGNPVFELPNGSKLAEAIKQIPLVVSFSEWVDETSECSTFVCPQPHPLEGWGDVEARADVVSIVQPTIQPLRDARTMMESFSAWSGTKDSADQLIKKYWKQSLFNRAKKTGTFEEFWNKTLLDGFATLEPVPASVGSFRANALAQVNALPTNSTEGVFTLQLIGSRTMLDGRHAHNPWLQELPDPVTKIVWDNYISLAPTVAEKIGIISGDVVALTAGDIAIELPAHIQFGQDETTLVVALGYGRKGTDRFTNIHPEWLQAIPTIQPGETVGKNAAVFLAFSQNELQYLINGVAIRKTGKTHTLARSQEYDSLKNPNLFGMETADRRPIIQQASYSGYVANPTSGAFAKGGNESMWADDHHYDGHRWGMAIDLSACTGCSACVVGCAAENNIPVVGKDEVRRNRELNWMRIDRYIDTDEESGELSVAHQPMLCQHCGNAPCETVCPVLATVHDSEGLNQQVYNRCVGTRYCANNCPYKIRHFNWFQYPRGDELQKMVLNPDVTVRDRGVMEKCSFCVQRIQLAKIEAKNEGRPLKDGDIKTACQQSCPADAIAFGDMNDPASAVSQKMKDPRFYRVLEELGVRPSVGYLTQVRNTGEQSTEVNRG
jgi:molybdopterin-containing oxidoreductase family iron-sulfur binding subunit